MNSIFQNVAAWLLFTMLCAADAPKVERLFPPGGQQGTTVSVKLSGKLGTRPIRVWSHADQLAIELGEKDDSATVNIPADATPGLHWLRFCNQAGASDLIPFVVGLIGESVEVEPNNTIASATPMTLPSAIVNGTLSKSGEVDIYQVQLKAKQTLVASVVANRNLGSPMDAVLQILDSDGVTLAQNDDDHALDPLLAFTAKQTGTYFVRVFAFPAAPNSTIRLAGSASYAYRLTLTTDAFVEFTIPLEVDGSVESHVKLHGWNLSDDQSTTLVSPQSPNSFFIHTAPASPLTIVRSANLSLTESEAHTSIFLQAPVAVSGLIAAHDETDSYRLAGRKGQKLVISAAARELYSQLDPVISLISEDGKVVKESDDISRENMDSSMAVSVPKDGDYTVQIRDRFDSGSSRHFYRLTCEQSVPGVQASVDKSSFVLAHDAPLEISIKVNRLNGHKEQITFAATGLPQGVEAQPVISEGKGDTAKAVTLKIGLNGLSEPFSGEIAIAGDSGSQTISVTTKLPNTSLTTDSLWLTAKPKTPEPSERTASEKS